MFDRITDNLDLFEESNIRFLVFCSFKNQKELRKYHFTWFITNIYTYYHVIYVILQCY